MLKRMQCTGFCFSLGLLLLSGCQHGEAVVNDEAQQAQASTREKLTTLENPEVDQVNHEDASHLRQLLRVLAT